MNTGKLLVYLQNITAPEFLHKKWRERKTPATCLPCPAGAICNGNIVPLDNNWGYMVNPTTVVFTQCPNSYCCSSQGTKCTSYDTCALGRTGIMCGSCAVGYAQSFVSEGCVLKNGVECNLAAFVVFFVAVSFSYTTIFTFLPTILGAIRNCILSRKSKDKVLI